MMSLQDSSKPFYQLTNKNNSDVMVLKKRKLLFVIKRLPKSAVPIGYRFLAANMKHVLPYLITLARVVQTLLSCMVIQFYWCATVYATSVAISIPLLCCYGFLLTRCVQYLGFCNMLYVSLSQFSRLH